MSCIVLDFELADKNVIMELGFLIHGNVQGYSFRTLKKYKPTKKAVWCTRNSHEILWNSGRWDHSELLNKLTRVVEGDYFATGTEK